MFLFETQVSLSHVITFLGACGIGSVLIYHLRYGTRLAFAERDSAKALKATEDQGKELAVTKNQVSNIERDIASMNSRMEKVDLLPEVKATMDAMQRTLEKMLPRTEHEQQIRQIEVLTEEVRETRSIAQDALLKANTALEHSKE